MRRGRNEEKPRHKKPSSGHCVPADSLGTGVQCLVLPETAFQLGDPTCMEASWKSRWVQPADIGMAWKSGMI